MTVTEIVKKAKDYCKSELKGTRICYNWEKGSLYHDKEMARCALQRCLGAVQFALWCGATESDVEWYNSEIREKFYEEFLDN